MGRFVHLENPDTYLPGLWDFSREPEARRVWAARLRTHLADTIRHAAAAEPEATRAHLERVAPSWRGVIDCLDDLSQRSPGRTVLELVAARDALFRGEHPEKGDGPAGPFDVFSALKERSNAWALPRYAETVQAWDAVTDTAEHAGTPRAAGTGGARVDPARLEHGLAGMLAGNVLDVASAVVAEAARAGDSAMERIVREVRERPLGIDGRAGAASLLDRLLMRREHPTVLLFVDNAGMDFVLGVVPFARELLRLGFRVALAANERPALNDVTCREAVSLLDRLDADDDLLAGYRRLRALRVVSTGNGTPGIDLGNVAEQVNAVEADLVLLVGQGRAVESTWNAVLARPSLRVATLKSPLVAERLGLSAFDTIVETREAGAGPGTA